MSQAIATRDKARGALEGLPSKPSADLNEIISAFEYAERNYNLVNGMQHLDHIMPMHQVSFRAEHIDSTVDNLGAGADCYRDPRFCKGNERALGKRALSKLMGVAGVQILGKQRLDDRSEPNYCEIEARLAIRDLDGTYRQVIATKQLDLRPGAPDTMKPEKDGQGNKTGRMIAYTDSALADKRRHIQSLCETEAIERALRLILNLKQKYTVDELAKPFVVPKLVADLDPNDPEAKTALINHALAGETLLFGSRPLPPPPPRLASAPPPLEAGAGQGAITSGDVIDGEVSDPEPTAEDRRAVLGQPVREEEEPPEFADVPEAPKAAAPQHGVCGCVCGHQKSLGEREAAIVKDRFGSDRCYACLPGTLFDEKAHAELGSKKMGLAKGDMTFAEAIKVSRKKKAERAA